MAKTTAHANAILNGQLGGTNYSQPATLTAAQLVHVRTVNANDTASFAVGELTALRSAPADVRVLVLMLALAEYLGE